MKLLVVADLHLRKDKPRCRLDEDWIYTQELILVRIVEQFIAKQCDLLCIIGDIFDTPTVPPVIESLFLKHFYDLKDRVCILPGNHDLQYGNYENIDKASYGIINRIFLPFGHAYGQLKEPFTEEQEFDGIHALVWPSKKAKPEMASGYTPEEIFDLFPNTKYILTGDYHQAFIAQNDKGQVIVNPGCISRQSAALMDYEPRGYIVDMDKNEIVAFELPDTAPVVTDNYLRKDEERNERIESFIELVENGSGEITLDFKENIRQGYDDLSDDEKNECESILAEAGSIKKS